VKAREFDVKDVATIPDDGSNPTDDCVVGVLEDRGDDPVVWELTAFIGAMSEDEQVDLVSRAQRCMPLTRFGTGANLIFHQRGNRIET
jgi:hypothetical protein